MADEQPKRPRGRPPLKSGEKSVDVSVSVPSSDYDWACALARKHQTSVAAIFRAAFRVAMRRPHTLDEP